MLGGRCSISMSFVLSPSWEQCPSRVLHLHKGAARHRIHAWLFWGGGIGMGPGAGLQIPDLCCGPAGDGWSWEPSGGSLLAPYPAGCILSAAAGVLRPAAFSSLLSLPGRSPRIPKPSRRGLRPRWKPTSEAGPGRSCHPAWVLGARFPPAHPVPAPAQPAASALPWVRPWVHRAPRRLPERGEGRLRPSPSHCSYLGAHRGAAGRARG